MVSRAFPRVAELMLWGMYTGTARGAALMLPEVAASGGVSPPHHNSSLYKKRSIQTRIIYTPYIRSRLTACQACPKLFRSAELIFLCIGSTRPGSLMTCRTVLTILNCIMSFKKGTQIKALKFNFFLTQNHLIIFQFFGKISIHSNTSIIIT